MSPGATSCQTFVFIELPDGDWQSACLLSMSVHACCKVTRYRVDTPEAGMAHV